MESDKMDPNQSLYEILDIRPTATQEQIEKGFRNQLNELKEIAEMIKCTCLTVQKEPKDKRCEMTEAQNEILNAYLILTDKQRKQDYDLGYRHTLHENHIGNTEFLI